MKKTNTPKVEDTEDVKKVMGAPKESVKEMAEKLTKKSKIDVSKIKNPDGSPVDDETMSKLKDIVDKIQTKEDPMDDVDFMETLKEIQSKAGTSDSQKLLDKLIAMQQAKKDGKLDEFFQSEMVASISKQKESHEKHGLTKEQRQAVHKFMHDVVKCDEYIVISMKEQEAGLQMEVLTQLKGEMVQSVLESVVNSIKNKTGITGSELVED